MNEVQEILNKIGRELGIRNSSDLVIHKILEKDKGDVTLDEILVKIGYMKGQIYQANKSLEITVSNHE